MTQSTLCRATYLTTIIGVFISSQTMAASDEYCQRYARHALENFQVAQEEGCEDLKFPVWSMDSKHHYDWCRTVSEAEAEQGGEMRVSLLRKCRSSIGEAQITGTVTAVDVAKIRALGRENSCREYANNAVNQQQENLKKGCGFSGPEWNARLGDHYNWCMHGENLNSGITEHQKRQAALRGCNAGENSPLMKDNTAVLDRLQQVQLDQEFLVAVNRNAAGIDKKIRTIQDEARNRARNLVLLQFNDEVKAATYYQNEALSTLPDRAGQVNRRPGIIGEIDKETGQVNKGSNQNSAPEVCEGLVYRGPPRITHILSSTKMDSFQVTPGDKLILFGENFYDSPGRVEILLPQGRGYLTIPLTAGNMNDWSRSWNNQLIVTDVPALSGLFDSYNARLSMMITHPCSGQKFSEYNVKLTPRLTVRQISAKAFLELAKGEQEDAAVDTTLDHMNFVKVSHYPGCGVKIPLLGAMTGSGEEGDDFFFKKWKLPTQFEIKKAYLVPKLPDKDWAGLISRILTDALHTVTDIVSGDVVGATLSLGGQAIEGLIKLFDPTVGKYGVWVTEYPPGSEHYRSHWNNTCYTKSPRFGQVLEYVGSFLIIGPDGLEPVPGAKGRYGVEGVAIAR